MKITYDSSIEAAPIVVDMYVPPVVAPYLDLEMIDEATIRATGAAIAPPFAYEPEFGVESTGLKYLRFSSDPNNQRLLSWFVPIGSHDEVYFRYLLYIEPDVKVGMTELGVKLPGPQSPDQDISLRLEHAPVTNGAFPLVTYFYDAENGSGYGKIESLGADLQEGRWNCIECRIKFNDVVDGVGQYNGILVARVNGVTTLTRTDVLYRWAGTADLTLTHFHVNVYHGGMGMVSSPIHYRIAKVYAGRSWAGVPAEMPTAITPPAPGTFPAWRNGKAKDVPFRIANTANMNGQALLGNGTNAQGNTLDAWNGLARRGSEWFALAGSGHDQGNGNGWENKVIKIDLDADSPQWLLVHPGSPNSAVIPAAYYSDGLPCARHTYYSAQCIGGRLMLFGCAAPYSLGFGLGSFQGGGQVDAFNPDTATWDAAGNWASCPIVYPSMAVATHPMTDDVYVSHSGLFYKWDWTSNTWPRIFPLVNGVYDNGEMLGNWRQGCPSLVDGTRNRLVYLGGTSFSFMDLATHECTTLAVTGYPGTDAGSAMVHDTDNDHYICVQGTQFYAIDPDTGVALALGAVSAAVNGVNGRLAYFPSLGGVAYASSYFHNITFLPTR